MKKIYFFATLLVTVPFLCFSQVKTKEAIVLKDKTGIIKSVEFPDGMTISKIPPSSNNFFKDFLKTSENDEFRNVPHKPKRKEFIHEHFDQYFKGIKVDGAGYNFHYKNGKMFFAQGNYVKIDNLNTVPDISSQQRN